MSYCRRCARALLDLDEDTTPEEALELDLAEAVDEVLAAVWDTAFELALDHGNTVVGMEHLLNALTVVPQAAAFLLARGVNVEGLGRDSARVIAAGADDQDVTELEIAPEMDLETSLELAVAAAEEDMRDRATLDDLLYVLSHYQADQADIDRLFGWIRRGSGRRTDPTPRTTTTARTQEAAPSRIPATSRGHLPSMDALIEGRLGGRAAGAPISLDRAGGAHTRLDRQTDAPYRVSRGPAAPFVSGPKPEPDARTNAGEPTATESFLAALEDRMDARFAALERSIAAKRGDDVGAARADENANAQLALMKTLGEALQRMALAQERTEQLLQRQIASKAVPDVELSRRLASAIENIDATLRAQQGELTRLGQSLERRASDGRVPGAAQSRASVGVRRGRRSPNRRRTSRRLRALRLGQVVRRGLRRMPRRRERSWWTFLSRPAALHAARQRGGRFRPFGERFNHRIVAQSRRYAADGAAEKRFYLGLDNDIVDAPSIGPRTAERLRAVGVYTVRDLLNCDVDTLAPNITARHITASVLTDWKDQARLVCTVPFLRGTHAQLLVGAGYRTPQRVAAADQSELMSAILRFATTREGQSVLRNGPPPEPEKVDAWVRNAGEAELERAA